MPPILTTNQLAKHFQVPTRQEGLKASIGALFHRTYNTVKAVDGVSFQIEPGEVVGFLGAERRRQDHHPQDAQRAAVPHRRAGARAGLRALPPRPRTYLRQITLVMGNRNQLAWDLPALDSFELQRAIYGIPHADFSRTPRRVHRAAGAERPGATSRCATCRWASA